MDDDPGDDAELRAERHLGRRRRLQLDVRLHHHQDLSHPHGHVHKTRHFLAVRGLQRRQRPLHDLLAAGDERQISRRDPEGVRRRRHRRSRRRQAVHAARGRRDAAIREEGVESIK